MKAKAFFLIAIFAFMVAGCKKDDGGTNPTPTPEDWTFPSDSTTSIKVFSEKSSVAVGETFDVKVILYNVTAIFGTAVEMTYNSANAQVSSIVAGPLFTPSANVLTVSNISAASNRASFGVTFKAGTGGSASGSGVVFKLKCVGSAAGTATFTINPAALEVRNTSNALANPTIGPSLNVTVR